MINLLKADFFRVVRTRLVYISLIIAAILPLFINGVYALSAAAAAAIEPELQVTGLGDSMFNSTFSPLMGFSFIFAAFPVIVIMMDFGNGTIRNKVIHGYNRHKIFAAHFIVSLIYAFVITTIFVVTNLLSSTLMLGISDIPASMIPTYLAYFFIGYLGVVLIASVGSGLALSLLNGGAIILTIISVLVINNIGSVIDLILQWQGVENTEYVLAFFPCYLTEVLSTFMNYHSEPKLELVLYIEAVLGVLIISGGFYALGTFVFNKRDFK